MKLSNVLTAAIVSIGLCLIAIPAEAQKNAGCYDKCYQDTNYCTREHSAEVCKEREAFCLDQCRKNQ